MDKVTRQLPQTAQPFRRERRAEAVLNRGPSGYQPNALPLGQTGSLDKPGKFFYTCSFAESHCTTPSSGIDQDNRCPLFRCYSCDCACICLSNALPTSLGCIVQLPQTTSWTPFSTDTLARQGQSLQEHMPQEFV